MKKRAVSPVIATVLLIALVTAAAAIVFLVVIPMLNPSPQAIVIGAVGVTYDDISGNFTVIVTIQAQSADLTFNGTVTAAPTVAYLNPTTSQGYAIANGQTGQITIVGSFTSGETYNLNIYFTAGESTIFAITEIVPTAT
ncbi:MAG: hypothetical protein KGD64_02705 [Candidatus Heimdallarchaeota archaeon]|nr:hypothetical protein [Candidatus Heimdallarchaeota archaeon]